MGDGWERVPLRRITQTGFDLGAQIQLAMYWSHSDWRGDPGKVYGFLWASIATVARECGATSGAAWKRHKKLVSAGYVVPLREMQPGELYLANHGREKAGAPRIECRCKSGRSRKNECSCRVLRPLDENGQLIRDPLDCPPDLHGVHVPRFPHPSPPQGSGLPRPRGTGPSPPQGGQTKQSNQPE